jgi:integrase
MPSLISKRGQERYRASVTVDGISRQKLFPDKTRKSYRQAVVWENETRKALTEELSRTRTQSLRIGNWANEYLEDSRNRFVPQTFEEKRSVFKRFFKQSGIKPEMEIESLSNSVCRLYLKRQFKKRSGNAANKDRKNLATAWNWGRDNLENWPEITNPFLAIKKFPEKRNPRYVPPESDFWKVYDVAEGQDRVMLLTFLHLGARRSEVFKLTWSDVDFTNNRIRLWTRKREGGNREFDWIPMTRRLAQSLREWRETRQSIPTIDNDHVFVYLGNYGFSDAYYGKPFKHRQQLMKRLCKLAGVKHFGFHAIRHLTASILYQNGESVAVIQAVLRHRNPNTTARYLRTLGLDETREALEKALNGPGKVIPFEKVSRAG